MAGRRSLGSAHALTVSGTRCQTGSPMRLLVTRRTLLSGLAMPLLLACSGTSVTQSGNSLGGNDSAGGSNAPQGGGVGTGGSSITDTMSSGGTLGAGGIAETGGAVATGGVMASGGAAAGGTRNVTGGAKATGGARATGGVKATGGTGTTSAAGSTGVAGSACTSPLTTSIANCVIVPPPSTGDYHQDCVDTINKIRADCMCLPPLARWTDGEACADQMAEYDSGQNSAHAGFIAKLCTPGGTAECECPGWSSVSSITQGTSRMESCLAMMWHEVDNPAGQQGHYQAMSNTTYTKVACGINASATNVWALQNYSR